MTSKTISELSSDKLANKCEELIKEGKIPNHLTYLREQIKEQKITEFIVENHCIPKGGDLGLEHLEIWLVNKKNKECVMSLEVSPKLFSDLK